MVPMSEQRKLKQGSIFIDITKMYASGYHTFNHSLSSSPSNTSTSPRTYSTIEGITINLQLSALLRAESQLRAAALAVCRPQRLRIDLPIYTK